MSRIEKIYIHIDAVGARPANGGFLMLTELAHHLKRYGYDVAVFDHKDRLFGEHFAWLQLSDENLPRIAPVYEVLEKKKTWILTSWLRGWFDFVLDNFHNVVPRLLYWCHDELLRIDASPYRDFVRKYIGKIAITNDFLLNYYEQFEFYDPVILRLWVRDDFKPTNGAKKHLVGMQTDRGIIESAQHVLNEPVLVCGGNHLEVKNKLQQCSYFLHWNPPKALIFEGEGFGLTVLEAMACGAVPIIRPHPGIQHLAVMFPEIVSMLQLPHIINGIDPFTLSLYQDMAINIIDDHYRFDLWRIQCLERYMEER